MAQAEYKNLAYKQDVIVNASHLVLESFGIDDPISEQKAKINGFYKTGYVEIKIGESTYDILPKYLLTTENKPSVTTD